MAHAPTSTASKGREERPASGDTVLDKARTVFGPIFKRQR
jgi:hypothetical protein